MNREQLFAAIGETDEVLLAETERRRPRRWARHLAAAACILLLLVGGVQALVRLEFLTAGCSAWPGDIVDGVYYYRVDHKGYYRYTPEEGSQLLVHTFFEDGCLVNEYGVYFRLGRSVYVREHESGRIRRLYGVSPFECSHIGISLMSDGTLDLTVYNKWEEWRYDLQLDGRTGEVLATLMEKTYFGTDYVQPWRQHFLVGGQEISVVLLPEELTERTEQEYGIRLGTLCDLQRDGISLLPEGAYISEYSSDMLGDYLLVSDYFYPAELAQEYQDEPHVLLVTPEGGTMELPYHSYAAASEGYLYYVDYEAAAQTEMESGRSDYAICCYELSSGESWALTPEQEGYTDDFYAIASDGTLLYTSAPWAGEQLCWKIAKDSAGRPAGLRLISADIAAE